MNRRTWSGCAAPTRACLMSLVGQNATCRIVRDEIANPPITDMIVHAANMLGRLHVARASRLSS
jgi:hypothetical protein